MLSQGLIRVKFNSHKTHKFKKRLIFISFFFCEKKKHRKRWFHSCHDVNSQNQRNEMEKFNTKDKKRWLITLKPDGDFD